MKEIDFERAQLLMSIMEKQANVSPMLTSVSGEAAQELKGIAEDCRQNAAERADKIRQEEQIAEAHRLEAAQADAEQNNKPRGPVQPAEGRVYMPGEPDPNVRSGGVGTRATDKDQNADPVIGRRV